MKTATGTMTRPNERFSALGFLVIGLALMATASPASAQFEKANQEYAGGQFKEAVADYDELVRKGEYSANLFYDLGNAHFRTEDFGRAVLSYERALALEPRHPEAMANLQIARERARALELQDTPLERILRPVTTTELAIVSAIALWIFLFAITRIALARSGSGVATAVAIVTLLAALAGSTGLYLREHQPHGAGLAIITSKDVEARVATADNTSRVMTLPAGSEIQILNRRGDWLYAYLPNQLHGWIPAASAESVRL